MRFAITVTDRYLGVFETLVEAGWTPVKLFTSPVDQRLFHNQAVIEYAEKLGLPIQLSRMTDGDLEDLAARDCEVLVVASYRWRIGDWRPWLKYAVNIHPSPLPDGRGPYPAVNALLEGHETWGVSCHKLSEELDRGDILDQEHFPLAPGECHESLDLKTQMAAKRLAFRLAASLPSLWQHARPQEEGSDSPMWRTEQRRLDFTQGVDAILRRIRAFGLIETVAQVNDITIYVRRAVGWKEPHSHTAGTVVHAYAMSLVVAAADGYIGIIEWSLLDPEAVPGRIGR